jgi:hypothetical protein
MKRLQRSGESLRSTAVLSAMLLAGCGDYGGFEVLPYNPDSPVDSYCSISTDEIFVGASKDGIAALSDPTIVPSGSVEAAYLQDDDRVIGVLGGVDALAVPLKILWFHEIVNIDVAGGALAVTHCPLTGSSMAFDRRPLDNVEFGVSGLLYRNNLIMYDRSTEESLWPQMVRGARCGTSNGTQLTMYPVVETTWGAWKEMHPNTHVISIETGHDLTYLESPYGDYEENDEVTWPFPLDFRRRIKERTLGVLGGTGGVLYPFDELASLGQVAVVDHVGTTSAPGGVSVFWDAEAQAAMAYSRMVDATELTFSVVGDQIVDAETGSTWRVDGIATAGPLVGRALDSVAESYVAYWFAWSGFEPGATLWEVS